MSDTDEDQLAKEAAELDGYFSDAPLNPKPRYPQLRTTFETAVVITNLPKVPEAKLEKLTKVVIKLVSRIGTLVGSSENDGDNEPFSGVFMPYDKEKGSTLGFCLVEYESPDQARNAVEVLQGYKFDKNHSLSVTLYSRAQKLHSLEETKEFREPTPEPFQEKPNATEWLEDSLQRDAYVVRYGRETVVNWFDAKNDPVVDYDGSREKEAGLQWCEYYCHWSPGGSYLATLVPARGVILWSGKTYEKTGRFQAPDVKHVVFSPQENFLLTSNERLDDPAAIKIYHIPTGKLLRAFALYPENISSNDSPPPPFLWSHDDKYIARMGKDLISIFETPGMRLLDKRSLAAEGVREFQWSPKANVIAYWVRVLIFALSYIDI